MRPRPELHPRSPQLLSEGPWDHGVRQKGSSRSHASARHQSNYAPLGMQLDGRAARKGHRALLSGNALHTLLEPLAAAIALPAVRYAGAIKAQPPDVRTVHRPRRDTPQPDPSGLGSRTRPLRRRLQRPPSAPSGTGSPRRSRPTRWGAIGLNIAIRTGILRDWTTTWKALIDSLAPILGRRRDASEFDVEVGRIVALALHHDVDPLLGNTIDVDVRWRLLERRYDGPQLDYTVAR